MAAVDDDGMVRVRVQQAGFAIPGARHRCSFCNGCRIVHHGCTVHRPTSAAVSTALGRLARPAGGFDAARYFRGNHGLRFYNVGTKHVRALARTIYFTNRDRWSVREAMRLANQLLCDPFLETKAVGIELVARYRRSFTAALLPAWKRWLASDLSANWATTDAICGTLIGPLLADNPRLIPEMLKWVGHRNMWVRRASAVALIPAMRRGLALDEAYTVAQRLHADQEDLIQKAVGWMLREAGKRDPERLERYLRRNGSCIPRTTFRYAIERFPAITRRQLLTSTRAGTSLPR
jgi:3-methyladenine DNA glycosylase AlkD